MNKNEAMGGADLGPNRGEGIPHVNAPRQCWAIKTLVAEVHTLFPETPVQYSNVDGRNTALAVAFDATGLSEDDRADFINLMQLLTDPAYNDDRRIEYGIIEDEQVIISMRSDPRTQDSREPFGLTDALHVLSGEDDGDDDEYWPNKDLQDPMPDFSTTRGNLLNHFEASESL